MTVFSTTPQEHAPSIRFSGYQPVNADDEERIRLETIRVNRMYFRGEQFDAINGVRRGELMAMPGGEKYRNPDVPMPEHERLHAYSTQIGESIYFIAGQLTDGMGLVAESATEPDEGNTDDGDEALQKIIDAAVDGTDRLRNDSDEDISFDDLMVDAAQAGDVVYETLWDPIRQTAYWEFWPAEQVEFDVPTGSWVKGVTRRSQIVVDEVGPNGVPVPKLVTERVVYDLKLRPLDDEELPHMECRRRVFHDNQEEPVRTDWLGLPFIPWGLLRINREGLNGYRGAPLINRQVLDNADRYNANEQTAYLVARFNSHGVLCVVGDQAFLKLQQDQYLAMDIADVLSFPGGTAAFPIQLPTDPGMLNHTKSVTEDAILGSFGLVRTDPDTLGGLGGVTGYALEILNRRSEGTFKRIRRTWKGDILGMVNQMLDVTAYRQTATLDQPTIDLFEERPDLEVPAGLLPSIPFWDIDPLEVFPNRNITVRMGSGYIVDDVQIRDDFTANLISREEALRLRGYSPDEIKKIMDEIKDREDQSREGTLMQAGLNPDGTQPVLTQAGSTVDIAERQARGEAVPSGTQAGATTGSTRRQ